MISGTSFITRSISFSLTKKGFKPLVLNLRGLLSGTFNIQSELDDPLSATKIIAISSLLRFRDSNLVIFRWIYNTRDNDFAGPRIFSEGHKNVKHYFELAPISFRFVSKFIKRSANKVWPHVSTSTFHSPNIRLIILMSICIFRGFRIA